jgi:tetratricopeptide (TPR) repeat protein
MMRLMVSCMLLTWLTAQQALGQCETWVGKPNQEDLMQDHVVYKGFLKENRWEEAFPYWEKVFKLAPYADGRRIDHFYDGQQFYIKKYEQATDPSEKNRLRELAISLFDQEASCTGNPGTAMARKGYYMFYNLNAAYPDTYKALKVAMDAQGKDTEYIVLTPMAYVLADQVKNKRISIDEGRDVFTRLVETAEHQISAGGSYVEQYKQSRDAMMPTLETIESVLFDCNWFKAKLEPEFRTHMADGERVREIYQKLIKQGCADTDPLLVEIREVYEVYAEKEKARLLAEFYQANPGAHAKALVEEGKYNEAIAKYQEAVEKADDNERKAYYYMELATLEFRHLERYSAARENARRSLKLKPNSGQPLILIGDMYARSYRSCGSNDFEQRVVIIAALDKYRQAKAIDDSVAAAANERISRYLSSRPSYEDGHMLGKKEGEKYTIGCWIGESVSLEFQK